MRLRLWQAAPGLSCKLLWPAAAWAHASERGHVLLLPTGHYLAGGALAVALSFAVLFLVPAARLGRLVAAGVQLPTPPAGWKGIAQALSALGLLALVSAGFWGSPDPLANPLPLTVWAMFWVGLTLWQATLGDLWSWLNPWAFPCALARRFGWRAPLQFPSNWSAWPALPLFGLFAWFELVDPAPDDPRRLAAAAAVYWLLTFVAMLLFGFREWSRSGEFFTILLGMLGRLAVTGTDAGRLRLRLPGAGLATARPLSPARGLLLIAALGAVSFDGLSQTFRYLGWIGANPLEHPGRSALMGANTLGLILTLAAMAAGYLGSIAVGRRLAGLRRGEGRVAGLLVWSLVPIALAYHFAHYAAAFLVDAQRWLKASSDPWGLGWNLFGTADLPVRAAVTAGSEAAWWLWNAQALSIVGGHLLAVLLAHGLAQRLCLDRRRAALFLLPLTALMVLYTLFGLWLLSTPAAG